MFGIPPGVYPAFSTWHLLSTVVNPLGYLRSLPEHFACIFGENTLLDVHLNIDAYRPPRDLSVTRLSRAIFQFQRETCIYQLSHCFQDRQTLVCFVIAVQ